MFVYGHNVIRMLDLDRIAGVIAPAAANAAAWDGGDWPKQVEGRVIEYLIITANCTGCATQR